MLFRSVSRKRTVSSRSETSVLKENKMLMLSPVPEGERSGNHSTNSSFNNMTPALKKKRKLYSMTPQHSEVKIIILLCDWSILLISTLVSELILIRRCLIYNKVKS